METAWEEGPADLSTGNSVLGTSDVLDRGVFTACTSSGGEVRARRAGFLLVAWMCGFGVSTSGWRSCTGVLAVDRSPADR